jgi:hypothetical protein
MRHQHFNTGGIGSEICSGTGDQFLSKGRKIIFPKNLNRTRFQLTV